MILVIVQSKNFSCELTFTSSQALRFIKRLIRRRRTSKIITETEGWMDVEFQSIN